MSSAAKVLTNQETYYKLTGKPVYAVLPCMKSVVEKELKLSWSKFSVACEVSLGALTSMKSGNSNARVQTVQKAFDTMNDLLKAENKDPLDNSEKIDAEVVFTNLETLRQNSKNKSIQALAKAVGVRKEIIEWAEASKPISKEIADRIVASIL